MKATFALIANNEIHNLVRKLSWDIHQKYQTGIDVTRLPPHISLKQPFDILNLTFLEEYMMNLARSITPFEVRLTELQLINMTMEGLDTGILWLNVQETKILRQLHNRVNEELTVRFGDVHAAFDGPDYHFHMTVAIGGQPFEIYQKIYDEFQTCLKDIQYTVQELVMFVYDEIVYYEHGLHDLHDFANWQIMIPSLNLPLDAILYHEDNRLICPIPLTTQNSMKLCKE